MKEVQDWNKDDWNRWDADLRKSYNDSMEEAKKGGSAEFAFYDAAQRARLSVTSDGLLPYRDQYGEFKYLPRQGIMAACLAREDAAVTAALQLTILKRLDRNRNLLAIAITILCYIGYKVS